MSQRCGAPWQVEAATWPIGLAILLASVAGSATAQDAGKTVFRCPGPPVLYTDALTSKQASERGCRPIDAAPLTIVESQPRVPPAATTAPGSAARSSPGARVEPGVQRQRDNDARRILNEELQQEQSSLEALRREYNDGQPERQGNERNYQRYLDRVAEMKATIARKEANIAALQRELGKLGP